MTDLILPPWLCALVRAGRIRAVPIDAERCPTCGHFTKVHKDCEPCSGSGLVVPQPGQWTLTANDEPTNTIRLDTLLAGWVPGSQPWTWDDEAKDIDQRGCCCRSVLCDALGHLHPGEYQRNIEAHIAEHGITQGVYPGPDGRVWDGHHRIVAAIRQGIEVLPVEEGAFPASGQVVGPVTVTAVIPIVEDIDDYPETIDCVERAGEGLWLWEAGGDEKPVRSLRDHLLPGLDWTRPYAALIDTPEAQP